MFHLCVKKEEEKNVNICIRYFNFKIPILVADLKIQYQLESNIKGVGDVTILDRDQS